MRKADIAASDSRIFGLEGRQKPPKQMLLPCALKNTSLCLQKKWPWHPIMRFLRLVCHMLTQRLRRIIFIDYNRRFRAREPYRVNGIVVRARQFGSNLLLLPGIELKESWRRQERRICLGSYANEMLHTVTLATFQTTDLEANQIARDENDVKFLILMLDGSWINPFKGEEQDLVCLPSSNLATPEIKKNLFQRIL